MKILYVISQDVDNTLQNVLDEQEKQHEIEVVDLRAEVDYNLLIEKIESCDQVISW